MFSGYISSANGALQNRLIIGSTTRSFTNTTFSFTETFNRKNAQHTFMITSKNELGVEGVIKGDITIDVEGPVATIIIN